MLQSIGSQRVGHKLVTEQQQKSFFFKQEFEKNIYVVEKLFPIAQAKMDIIQTARHYLSHCHNHI